MFLVHEVRVSQRGGCNRKFLRNSVTGIRTSYKECPYVHA